MNSGKAQTQEVILANAFTINGAGGNPAGLVLNADNLSNEQRLRIAQIVGYSETAFISADAKYDFQVAFFTTTGEIDFCGHATVASFSIMHKLGLLKAGLYYQKTKAGVLPVIVNTNSQVVMEQKLPVKMASFSYQEVASLIGIDSLTLASTHLPIEAISTGLADVMIPVPFGYLDSLQANDALISEFCRTHSLIGLHVFELCGSTSPYTASCRNFAPLVGISEESATGSSNGALACYLAEHVSQANHFVFEQGRAMKQASMISASIEYEASQISRVCVGGSADISGTINIEL